MPLHPFQCLAVAHPPGSDNGFLLAACGPKVVSTSLGETGTCAEWPSTPVNGHASTAQGVDSDERPAKKQKAASEIPTASNVIKLTVSPGDSYARNSHAVIVTEDKLVRVCEIKADGSLLELSQRAMPKRPCAIQISPDNRTIFCGDKFGDVYALPLLPTEGLEGGDAATSVGTVQVATEAKLFKPSASTTTVHTKRNRKALEAQLKQKNLTAKTKEPLKFEHKLLLGHVSMLTDMLYVTRGTGGRYEKRWIITADRDEHIRISRGPPQSHIIEGYCLGHTQYVSKIREVLLPQLEVLLSGGGDDWIGVWDWLAFKLKRKIDVRNPFTQAQQERSRRLGLPPTEVDHVNISGIWLMPLSFAAEDVMPEHALVVACERVPAMLVCPVANLLNNDVAFTAVTPIDAPVLDIVAHELMIVASFDDRHDPQKRLQTFQLRQDEQGKIEIVKPRREPGTSKALEMTNAVASEVNDEKALDALLYGVAGLRKRRYQNGEEGGEVEAESLDADQEGVEEGPLEAE